MKPSLIIKDGEYFVTDGEINGAKFIVKKQPSKAAIDFLHRFFIDEVKRSQNNFKEVEYEQVS